MFMYNRITPHAQHYQHIYHLITRGGGGGPSRIPLSSPPNKELYNILVGHC